MTASRQKLSLAGSKSNFHFTPESRLNSEIPGCPKCPKTRLTVQATLPAPAERRWKFRGVDHTPFVSGSC